MKTITRTLLSLAVCTSLAVAGDSFKAQFEEAKDTSKFDKVEFGFKADLTFTYQALDQKFEKSGVFKWWETPGVFEPNPTETELQGGLVLPTANLDIYAKIMSGFNVKLQTMLSSHHHNETYVKGGDARIDNLDFISDGFASAFMKDATIKLGVNDINFGDAHFRRTDNASVFKNPFVHNLAVEAYMQAGFVEVFYRIPSVNMFVLGGLTNGQVNPDDVVESGNSSSTPAMYGKIGFDQQISDALRVRVSESIYNTGGNGNNSLYNGDKAGTVSREIFNHNSQSPYEGDFGSSWDAMTGYDELTVSMTNAYIKYNGTELFGTLEFSSSQNKDMVHYALDAVQRFGKDKFYVAARYENATVETDGDTTDDELTQYQLATGWFITENAMAKVEYISQEREGMSAYVGGKAEFSGFMVSTALTF